ncbi:hypothetical protein K435DRAFT_803180, partial [Dendrothele bispora CBS 962.96]
SFRKDSILLKGTVALVGMLETVHSVLLWFYLYSKTVSGFGEVQELIEADWVLSWILIISGLIAFIVQIFFIYQAYKLVSNFWYITVFFPAALAQLGLGSALAILIHSVQILDLSQHLKNFAVVSLALPAVVDLANTIVLFKIQKSMKTIDRLIIWTIETGTITSLFAVIQLILVLSSKSLAFLLFSFQISEVYSTAFLAL